LITKLVIHLVLVRSDSLGDINQANYQAHTNPGSLELVVLINLFQVKIFTELSRVY